jgi:hypothetical protein
MRGLGLIGLLIALVIVGLMAKKQFATVATPVVLPSVPGAAAPPADATAGTVRDQGKQVQDQYKKALDAAMQQSQRQMPDDN